MQDNDFKKFYSALRQSLLGLRRDIDYPILDIDGKKLFPNFTRLINSAFNEIILTSKIGGKRHETIDYSNSGPIHIKLKLSNGQFGIYKYVDIPEYYRNKWHLSDKKDYFIIEEGGNGDRFQYIDDKEIVSLIKNSEDHIRIGRNGNKFTLYVFSNEEANIRYWTVSSAVENEGVSAMGVDKKGGIAFNALPIQVQMGSALVGTVPLNSLGIDRAGTVPKIDIDSEWAQIEQIFNAGIRPSIDRMGRYSLAAAASPLAEEKIDQVRAMLADILRRDEESESLVPADEACKELLKRLEA